MSSITSYNKNKDVKGSTSIEKPIDRSNLGGFSPVPSEIIRHILSFLPYNNFRRSSFINRFFYHITTNMPLWNDPIAISAEKVAYHVGHKSFDIKSLPNKRFLIFLNDDQFLCQSLSDDSIEVRDLKSKELIAMQPHTKSITFCSKIEENRFVIIEGNTINICTFKIKDEEPFKVLYKYVHKGKISLREHAGNLLCVGYENGNIEIFNLKSNEKPITLTGGHQKPISSLRVLGNHLISGSSDAATIWNLECSKSIYAFPTSAFTISGDYLYYHDREKRTIIVYNLKKKEQFELTGDKIDNILSLDVKGNHLIAKIKVNYEIFFQIWDLKTKETWSISMKNKSVSHCEVIDERLFVGFLDGDIKIYNLHLELVGTLKGHTSEITCFKLLAGYLFSGAKQRSEELLPEATVKIWNLETQKYLASLPLTDSITRFTLADNCLFVQHRQRFVSIDAPGLESTTIWDFGVALVPPKENSNIIKRTFKGAISYIKNF
jgi:hypothetical protein